MFLRWGFSEINRHYTYHINKANAKFKGIIQDSANLKDYTCIVKLDIFPFRCLFALEVQKGIDKGKKSTKYGDGQ